MTGQGDSPGRHGQQTSPACLRWSRDFPGDPGQVRHARHWVKDLLPSCPPLDDAVEIVSELAANAVTHTRSSRRSGRFAVELAWSPELVRVVVGDEGAPSAPRLIEDAGDTGGRGLLIVDRLSDAWGIAGGPPGRWVWADVPWAGNGGPLLRAPGGGETAAAELARLRRAYAGVPVWYGQSTGAWRAALPASADTDGLISAPSLAALDRMLALRCTRRPVPGAPDSPGDAAAPAAPDAAGVSPGARRAACRPGVRGPW